jgi:hypothetical protein
VFISKKVITFWVMAAGVAFITITVLTAANVKLTEELYVALKTCSRRTWEQR